MKSSLLLTNLHYSLNLNETLNATCQRACTKRLGTTWLYSLRSIRTIVDVAVIVVIIYCYICAVTGLYNIIYCTLAKSQNIRIPMHNMWIEFRFSIFQTVPWKKRQQQSYRQAGTQWGCHLWNNVCGYNTKAAVCLCTEVPIMLTTSSVQLQHR